MHIPGTLKLYRGIKLKKDGDKIKELKAKKSIYLKGFQSFSTDDGVAKGFATKDLDDKKEVPILLYLENNSVKNRFKMGKGYSKYDNEKEYLI